MSGMFKKGTKYTRKQIHSLLGGGLQDYLPHVDQCIVAACIVPRINPNAPRVILPGKGPGIERWAGVFANQPKAVPLFIKVRTNNWEYVGDFVVGKRTTRPNDIYRFSQETGRNDISQILFLKETDGST